jgi:hypothetical protein
VPEARLAEEFFGKPLSDDGVALSLEDPERPGAHGDEVAFLVVDLRLGGRGAAGAVDYLAAAGDATLVDRAEEVDVHLYGGGPDAHEREHREAHGVVYERGVDPAVQGARAVEVVNHQPHDQLAGSCRRIC